MMRNANNRALLHILVLRHIINTSYIYASAFDIDDFLRFRRWTRIILECLPASESIPITGTPLVQHNAYVAALAFDLIAVTCPYADMHDPRAVMMENKIPTTELRLFDRFTKPIQTSARYIILLQTKRVQSPIYKTGAIECTDIDNPFINALFEQFNSSLLVLCIFFVPLNKRDRFLHIGQIFAITAPNIDASINLTI